MHKDYKVLSKYPFTFSNVKTYLACNFRYFYGAQNLLIFKYEQNFNEMRYHIRYSITLFQPMLNYCRKYEDVKFNIFEDMTMSSRCILFRTPGIFSRTHSPNNCAPTATEINISPVPYIVSDSRYFVPVTRNSCRSFVYDILLKFENLPVMKSRNRAGQ